MPIVSPTQNRCRCIKLPPRSRSVVRISRVCCQEPGWAEINRLLANAPPLSRVRLLAAKIEDERSGMQTKDWWYLIATIVSPFIAAGITALLTLAWQSRAEKRAAKLH